MPNTDPRIDAYMAKAAPFAQPILAHLRSLAHRALPDCEEGIKWGMPRFMLGGKNIAGMAAFKAHCAFTIHGEGRQGEGEGMGSCGRIASLADLPADEVLIQRLQAAAGALAEGAGKPKPRKPLKPEIPMPDDLETALGGSPEARANFDGLAPSHRREYLEWVTEAKQAATRQRRIAQAIEWLAEGKKRNWKYEAC